MRAFLLFYILALPLFPSAGECSRGVDRELKSILRTLDKKKVGAQQATKKRVQFAPEPTVHSWKHSKVGTNQKKPDLYSISKLFQSESSKKAPRKTAKQTSSPRESESEAEEGQVTLTEEEPKFISSLGKGKKGGKPQKKSAGSLSKKKRSLSSEEEEKAFDDDSDEGEELEVARDIFGKVGSKRGTAKLSMRGAKAGKKGSGGKNAFRSKSDIRRIFGLG